VTVLLTRFVKLGVFPPAPPTLQSQPSFFGATLSTIRARLRGADWQTYSEFWSDVILSLPSTFVLRAVLTSLFSYLFTPSSGLDSSPSQRGLVKREATLLKRLAGRLSIENGELWECVTALILSRDWDVGRARIFICWLAGCDGDDVNEEGGSIYTQPSVCLMMSYPSTCCFPGKGHGNVGISRAYQTLIARSTSVSVITCILSLDALY
jgi:telomere length regulation protein